MKLPQWLSRLTPQARWMVAFIALLLILIASRWGYISYTASQAVKARFIPPAEQTTAPSEQSEQIGNPSE